MDEIENKERILAIFVTAQNGSVPCIHSNIITNNDASNETVLEYDETREMILFTFFRSRHGNNHANRKFIKSFPEFNATLSRSSKLLQFKKLSRSFTFTKCTVY